MLDETVSKLCIKKKKVISRGKRIKSLRKLKWVENICKNPQIFLEKSRKAYLVSKTKDPVADPTEMHLLVTAFLLAQILAFS